MGVVLTDIGKAYADSVALAHVSLVAGEGEFLTLLGASGSGKSTLLNVVAGLIAPDAGSVVIQGRDVTHIEPRKRGLGMVFQSYALAPHLTVAENIAFPLQVRHLPRAEIRRRVAHILDVVQLGNLAARKPRELSGGQQQRVAIARCLVYEPPVILMDEPLGALDKKLREQLQREIRRIHRDTGVTVLYVTHDQEEAMFLSDRICLMRAGRVEQVGTPQELYFRPKNAFVADFLGESNMLACRLESATVATLAGGQRVNVLPEHANAVAQAKGKLWLMLRPDRLHFVDAVNTVDGAVPEINILRGVIEDAAFAGETTRYGVRVGAQLMAVKTRCAPNAQMLPPGHAVCMAWHPEDALILPEEGDAKKG